MISKNELFDLICSRFRNKSEAQRAMADKMNITPEAVKKWMYNDIDLGYERVRELVRKFDIQPAEIFRSQESFINFKFIEFDFGIDNMDSYLKYMDGMAAMFEYIAEDPEARISFRADDIPIFHLMPFRGLSYFKLYCYAHDIQGHMECFEDFVDSMPQHVLNPVFDRIAHAYEEIGSIEIWDDQILNMLLFHIQYMHDMKLFRDSSSTTLLLKELEELILRFWHRAELGKKANGASFKFFKMGFPVRLGSMLVEYGNHTTFVIKLDTINSISTTDSSLSKAIVKLFKAAVDKSVALGFGAKRERTIYFRKLIDRITKTRAAVGIQI